MNPNGVVAWSLEEKDQDQERKDLARDRFVDGVGVEDGGDISDNLYAKHQLPAFCDHNSAQVVSRSCLANASTSVLFPC